MKENNGFATIMLITWAIMICMGLWYHWHFDSEVTPIAWLIYNGLKGISYVCALVCALLILTER